MPLRYGETSGITDYVTSLGDGTEQPGVLSRLSADGAQFVIVSPPRKPWIENQRPILSEYSKMLPGMTYWNGIPFCDARRRFLDSGDPNKGYAWLFADDPVHPSKAGHDLIARALVDVLWDLAPVKKLRPPPAPDK